VMQNNRNKMEKIKVENAQLLFNEVSLSIRLSPGLEFPNSRINHLVFKGIHNRRVHLILVPVPKKIKLQLKAKDDFQ